MFEKSWRILVELDWENRENAINEFCKRKLCVER